MVLVSHQSLCGFVWRSPQDSRVMNRICMKCQERWINWTFELEFGCSSVQLFSKFSIKDWGSDSKYHEILLPFNIEFWKMRETYPIFQRTDSFLNPHSIQSNTHWNTSVFHTQKIVWARNLPITQIHFCLFDSMFSNSSTYFSSYKTPKKNPL